VHPQHPHLVLTASKVCCVCVCIGCGCVVVCTRSRHTLSSQQARCAQGAPPGCLCVCNRFLGFDFVVWFNSSNTSQQARCRKGAALGCLCVCNGLPLTLILSHPQQQSRVWTDRPGFVPKSDTCGMQTCSVYYTQGRHVSQLGRYATAAFDMLFKTSASASDWLRLLLLQDHSIRLWNIAAGCCVLLMRGPGAHAGDVFTLVSCCCCCS
jgi:hypothetical protein